MTQVTTIQLDKSLVQEMKELREYPRQTYNELLKSMMQSFKESLQKKRQYDEFLHKIQQPKMQELWDNKEDEAWDDV